MLTLIKLDWVNSMIKHRDLVQFNWYRYALKGFTRIQKDKYTHSVKYYAQLVKATPPWCDLNHVWDIFLTAAIMRREGRDVQTDHMVPVNHPYVCGLHCPDNLRNIPSQENQRKSNNHWDDMRGEQLCLELVI